jgi:hypothetical protein
MEIPQQGRAIINEEFDYLEIICPAKRITFVFGFLAIWLCGWFFGEFTAIASLISNKGPDANDSFMLFWLCGWTVGGAFALRIFWWMLMGKEIVKAGQGTITITKKGAFFIKPKTYNLNDAKNFRIQVTDDNYCSGWGSRGSKNGLDIANAGTIRFDYGMQTIKFAEGVDEAEAGYLLQRLKAKKILTDKNFEIAKPTY